MADVQQALAKRAAGWHIAFPDTPAPGKDWLLVFVSDDMDAMRAAAAAAVAVGYERTAVLEGGVQALTPGALQQASAAKPTIGCVSAFPKLSRG